MENRFRTVASPGASGVPCERLAILNLRSSSIYTSTYILQLERQLFEWIPVTMAEHSSARGAWWGMAVNCWKTYSLSVWEISSLYIK